MSDKFWNELHPSQRDALREAEATTRNLFYEQFRQMVELEACCHRATEKAESKYAALVEAVGRYIGNIDCPPDERAAAGGQMLEAWKALTNGGEDE